MADATDTTTDTTTEADTQDVATTDAATTEESTAGEEALGDPGKKALDAMKAKEKAARERARAAEEERDRLKAAAEGREAEWEAEKKARDEADRRFNERYIRAEMKAAAKGKLANPSIVDKFLDISEFEVSPDGDVDTASIEAAIDDLLRKEPYLAVQDGRRFQGSSDSGPRNDGPQQVTQAQLDQMSIAEINKARREGRLDKLLGKP